MTSRDRLHKLVDQLPACEVATAARVLEALAANADPLAGAPEDDEPTTTEDRHAVTTGWQLYQQGRGNTLSRP